MFRSDQLDKQLLQAQAGDFQRVGHVAALAQDGGGLESADHIRTDDMAARAIVIYLTDAAGDAVALVQQMLGAVIDQQLAVVDDEESRMQEGDSL